MVLQLLGGILALFSTIILGFFIIRLLQHLEMGQKIRKDGPERHLKKEGIPTMGGVMILLGLTIGIVFTHPLTENLLWLFFITFGFGLMGLLDDLIKVLENRSLGLRAWQKILGQLIIALIFSLHLMGMPLFQIIIPFTDRSIHLGSFIIPFSILVIIGTANGVNITDGLDGLAAGNMCIISFGYSLLTFILGYQDLSLFALALAFACLGFLWFNSYPAQVIMGDTGSLALGGALAGLSLLSGTPLFLFFFGGIFVLETLSVIIQVISFQTTGKRIFRMSPVHHHFELVGWEEPKIVTRFIILTFIFILIAFFGLWSHL